MQKRNMTLHIFNPEHDIALASGLSNFTAPHAGRQLRHDLGFLPALWAQQGDIVITDDPELAAYRWKRLSARIARVMGTDYSHRGNIRFVPWKLTVPTVGTSIEPWGWNSALRAQLLRSGVAAYLLPQPEALQTIRELSHRHTAAVLLPKLRVPGTVGESFECQTREQVEMLLQRFGHIVMKAPWSSSGRGLRFLAAGRTPFEQQQGWFQNVVAAQGCVMVEPYYNKVKDLGMEFYSDGQGHIDYLGLSLFHTTNGAYTGNILASEEVKQEMISRYVTSELMTNVREKICQEAGALFNQKYRGPFGVDMMIIANGTDFLLHPCVEINLRRTMGHTALALSPKDDRKGVMRIDYADNTYRLKVSVYRSI